MLISGLQKLTLLDYPGKVACTVFTGGCNFRCPFCHNSALVLPDQIAHDSSEDAVLAFLSKRVGVLDGVAVTGGEPLLHADIGDFLKEVKALGFLVKLDTNGSFPDRLIALVKAGLVDRVAMDIKNAPALYAKTAGLAGHFDLSGIEKSKDFLLEGRVDYEFRTTVVKGLHTAESLVETAHWIERAKEYYLQQYKDSGAILDSTGLSGFDADEMHALADAVRPIVPAVQVRGC
ncbi:MAG: anaerobic ribonucleoside-triphosphate reductase activating protein [Oscillospiraceae bacterium]|nr:anaerobic ribonucleoside-triphosphate reductase activating protein [Oscillospiraceae bacterium]